MISRGIFTDYMYYIIYLIIIIKLVINVMKMKKNLIFYDSLSHSTIIINNYIAHNKNNIYHSNILHNLTHTLHNKNV
jgi:hypothetical protein